MTEIFLTTLPIYLIIALGYVAVRWGYIERAHVAGLGQFALKLGLPALIFLAIAFPRGDAQINASFFLAYLLGSLGVLAFGLFVSGVFLRRPAQEGWMIAFGMTNSNSGFLGFPLASLFFGSDGALVFAVTMTLENTIIIPLVTIGATMARERAERGGAHHSLGQILRPIVRKVVTNPLIVAVLAALVVRSFGVSAPAPVELTLRMLSAAAAPVALFVIGGTVAGMSFAGHVLPSSIIAFGKLIVHPACVAVALWIIPGVPPGLIPVGILFAAVPMLTIYPLLTAPFGLAQLGSAALLLTTVVSVVSVSGVMALLDAM